MNEAPPILLAVELDAADAGTSSGKRAKTFLDMVGRGTRPGVAPYGDQMRPKSRQGGARDCRAARSLRLQRLASGPDPVLIASAQPRHPPELWKSRDPRQAGRSPGSVRDFVSGEATPACLLSRRRHGKVPALWCGSRAHADVTAAGNIGRRRASAISFVFRLQVPILADPVHPFRELRMPDTGCGRNEPHRLHADGSFLLPRAADVARMSSTTPLPDLAAQ